MEDLGAPSGFLIDLMDPDGAQITEDLSRASVIVIESGIDLDPMLNGFPQPAIDGLEQALNNGCVILVEGVGINLFGRWIMTDGGDLVDGLTVTPLGEQYFGIPEDIAGKSTGSMTVVDFGPFPGNSPEVGVMLVTNGDRGDGTRGGATQGTEAHLFSAP